jgi:predicted nucleic acid-binding Zn finger protein
VKENQRKIDLLVSEGRVKLHVFEPSNRKIWTIVGKTKEHWIDPELDFCSCASYYFNSTKDKRGCYHLDSLRAAQQTAKVELIKFSDDEFDNFIAGLISDL